MATEKKQQTDKQLAALDKQWVDLKSKHPDAVLLFRHGDFYELYKQDAEVGGKTLGITVTKRTDGVDMASFPHYALDTYLPKLIRAGHRVAICDHLEVAKKQKVAEEAKPSKEESKENTAEKEQKAEAAVTAEKVSKGKKTTKKGSSAKSAEDKALDKFADMMIEKINSFNGDWKKPWLTEGAMAWPKNLSGREYNGMNALMLMMHAEKEGYKIPVYATFATLQRLNQAAEEKAAKKGEEAQRVTVNKGEHAFPVMLTTFTVIDKETKERIKYDDYKQLSDEEKEKYKVYPKMQVYNVFNVAQTNMQEMRPDLWQKLENENTLKLPEAKGEQFTFEPVEKMIKDNLWICPIKTEHQDNAYYSITKNEIVVPEKRQFKDGESFYGTLFHEMTHSTGQESVLNRIKPAAFGSDDYAREELVAELGSALVAQRYGMSKNLKEDSAAYLKSWLESLKESPEFIKTTLTDVKKATAIITQGIDGIAEKMEKEKSVERQEGKEVGVKDVKPEDTEKVTEVEKQEKKEQPMYYSSVAYLQMSDDTRHLEELKDKGDYKALLQEAAQYDQGEAISLHDTHKSPLQNRGDDILDENDKYAVVYNASVGGTFDIMRKVKEQEVINNIQRYGLSDDASKDVRELASKMESAQDIDAQIVEKSTAKAEQPMPSKLFAEEMDKAATEELAHPLANAKNLSEVREFFKDGKDAVSVWVRNATDKQLIENGADMLPNLRYNHKEGRTLYDMETAFSQINAKYEDVTDERTKQIAHRISQAESIIKAYHSNVEDIVKIAAENEKYAHRVLPPQMYRETEVKEEVSKDAKTSVENKTEDKETKREEKAETEKQKREPQLVTVNGDKVSHAHAFQHNQNPDIWLFTAKINDKPLHPMVMTKEDVAAYQAKETTVKDLMERYYPTKMQKQLSPEEYKAGTKLSDGQTVDKFRVFKESVKEHDDFGKWKGYAEVGGKKMVAVMSSQDLNAYFDRTQTPAQIVERTFGERLHLASAYKDYKLPDGVKEENVRISKDRDGKWKVSVDLGDKGMTPKKQLSFDDGQSFFRTKTATRGQLAAKYLAPEMHSMLSEKQEVKKAMKR